MFPVNNWQHVFANPTHKSVYFTSNKKKHAASEITSRCKAREKNLKETWTNPPCLFCIPHGIWHKHFPQQAFLHHLGRNYEVCLLWTFELSELTLPSEILPWKCSPFFSTSDMTAKAVVSLSFSWKVLLREIHFLALSQVPWKGVSRLVNN